MNEPWFFLGSLTASYTPPLCSTQSYRMVAIMTTITVCFNLAPFVYSQLNTLNTAAQWEDGYQSPVDERKADLLWAVLASYLPSGACIP